MGTGVRWGTTARRLLALWGLTALVLLVACEKPDASFVTSPSALALLGTTSGAVRTADIPPPPTSEREAPGWAFDLGNARFSHLENGTPSIQVVTQLLALPGARMALWILSGDVPVFYWTGGTTREYNGVFCFQLALASGKDALPLGPGPHRLAVAFVDATTGEVRAAKTVRVAGFPPELQGGSYPPGPSAPGTQLLGCPRSVI